MSCGASPSKTIARSSASQAEMQRVLRRSYTAFCPSAALPESARLSLAKQRAARSLSFAVRTESCGHFTTSVVIEACAS